MGRPTPASGTPGSASSACCATYSTRAGTRRRGRPGEPEITSVPAQGRAIKRGYEGYVAKDEASAYEGGPTRRWLKVKQPNWTVEDDRWRRRLFGWDR